MKDIAAPLADGVRAGNARNLLGRPVERRYLPLLVDREHAIDNRVENHISRLFLKRYGHGNRVGNVRSQSSRCGLRQTA